MDLKTLYLQGLSGAGGARTHDPRSLPQGVAVLRGDALVVEYKLLES